MIAIKQIMDGVASSIGRPEQPVTEATDRILKRINGIGHRLKSEGLEINPRDIFFKVASHVARIQLASEDPKICRRPRKALLISGPVGCGKTTLLKRAFARSGVPVISSRSIIADAEKYVDAFEYDRRHLRDTDVVLDDIGAERLEVKCFGTTIDIRDWIEWRYDRFVTDGVLTYVSTNIPSWTVLGQIYGERIASRLSEMCEAVRYNHYDRRRR